MLETAQAITWLEADFYLFFRWGILLILFLKNAFIFEIIQNLLRLLSLLLLVFLLFILENGVGLLLFLNLLLYLIIRILFGLQLFLISLDTFDMRSNDFLAFFGDMFLLSWDRTCLGGEVALGVSVELETHLGVVLARCVRVHKMLDQSFLHRVVCAERYRWLRLRICQFISVACFGNLRHSLRCRNSETSRIHLR